MATIYEKMTTIADRFRGYKQATDKFSLDEMPSAIDYAFSLGYDYYRVFTDHIAKDDFWDVFQCNGQRTNYAWAYAGNNFTDATLKPKYKMKVSNACQMFRGNINITDLSGIDMDFSQCTDFTQAFGACSALAKVGNIDMTSATDTTGMFFTSRQVAEIGTLKVSETTAFEATTFGWCQALTTISFEGTIGQTISFVSSPLNKASIENIVTHLSNTAAGKTLTLKTGQVATVFETSEGAADGTSSAEWLSLIGAKSNWTISV